MAKHAFDSSNFMPENILVEDITLPNPRSVASLTAAAFAPATHILKFESGYAPMSEVTKRVAQSRSCLSTTHGPL